MAEVIHLPDQELLASLGKTLLGGLFLAPLASNSPDNASAIVNKIDRLSFECLHLHNGFIMMPAVLKRCVSTTRSAPGSCDSL